MGDSLDLGPYRKKVGFFRFYLIVIIVLSAVFYLGYQVASARITKLETENAFLKNSVDNLSRENEKISSQYNVLKVELDIAQLANEQSQLGIKDGIIREQSLKEQVSFYQRVLAPELSQDGFTVERMEVSPTASENNYAIKMILLQDEDIKAVIKGELAITLHGSANGEPKSLNLVNIQDSPKTSLAFAFKYFQVIETRITLPEGFIPERFEFNTEIYKYRKRQGSYSNLISWSDAFSEIE